VPRIGVAVGETIGEQREREPIGLPVASAASIRPVVAAIASSTEPASVSAMTREALFHALCQNISASAQICRRSHTYLRPFNAQG
jgi:hypothetical protein